MKEKLPKDVFKKGIAAINEDTPLDGGWLMLSRMRWKGMGAGKRGATVYAFAWIQPMTEYTAEKRDAFVDPIAPGEVIERFSDSSWCGCVKFPFRRNSDYV